MGDKTYHFAGWATRNDRLCSDGRTIRRGAFIEDDGKEVPIVWNHQHSGPENVLGHAVLENRDEGVYCYGWLNDTKNGREAKELIRHGDITNLSIFANHLRQRGGDVIHGVIREVSLVLAGANPGAKIETVLCHSEGNEYEEDAIISMDDDYSRIEELLHSDDEDDEDDKKKKEEKPAESEEKPEDEETNEGGKEMAQSAENDKTVQEVFDTLTEEQKTVVYALIGAALEDKGGAEEDEDEGEEDMRHNAFDVEREDDVLMHSEEALAVILADAKRCGSLKESFLQHADEYGITNIDLLFPEARNLDGEEPGFISRQPSTWVTKVMNGVHKSPFSRTKSMFADITEDEARAKGYIKGRRKKDEVFSLLKRTTSPTTIYKKQKLDRDDVIDIKDFNVVAWIKKEMRVMLDEEIARAILFGDGRIASSEDKVDENCIRPVISDNQLFSIKVGVGATVTEELVDKVVIAMDDYQGSGHTTLFADPTVVTTLLLIKDEFKHRLYKNLQELANAMGVDEIVKLPKGICPAGIKGVILDLNDYNVGTDKGGELNSFEDFDIDYNQMKYLMEGRMSGALRKPFSAIVLKDTLTAEEEKDWKTQHQEQEAAQNGDVQG